jgi:hypothetical protein
MLRRLRDLENWDARSRDGQDLGKIEDFYFDDERWTVRYVVIAKTVERRHRLGDDEAFATHPGSHSDAQFRPRLEQTQDVPAGHDTSEVALRDHWKLIHVLAHHGRERPNTLPITPVAPFCGDQPID